MSKRKRSLSGVLFTVFVVMFLFTVCPVLTQNSSTEAYASGENALGWDRYLQVVPTATPQYFVPPITADNFSSVVEVANIECESADDFAWSPNGELLAMSCGNDLLVYDVKHFPNTAPFRLEGHSEPVHIVTWSPDGKTLVSASHDGTVRLWKVASRTRIGPLVVASSIDENGCALGLADNFSRNDTVYIVAENSDVPQGTTVFVRLYASGRAVEDTAEITADTDYERTCVNFLFEPVEGETFDVGNYEAELFVNGNPAGTVGFTIR